MNRVQVGLGASLGSIDDGLCGLAGLDWTERLLIDGPRARMQPNKWTLYCEGENGEQTTPSGLGQDEILRTDWEAAGAAAPGWHGRPTHVWLRSDSARARSGRRSDACCVAGQGRFEL
jgi:hypothetical protein